MAGRASSDSVFCLVRPGSSLSQCCCTCLGSRHFSRPFLCTLAVRRSTSRDHVSDSLNPEHPSICGEIEESLTSLSASCCCVSCSRWKLAVVCLYRSPSICVCVGLGDFCQLLSKLSLCSRHIVLAGDLNINLLSDCSATANYQNILSDSICAWSFQGDRTFFNFD